MTHASRLKSAIAIALSLGAGFAVAQQAGSPSPGMSYPPSPTPPGDAAVAAPVTPAGTMDAPSTYSYPMPAPGLPGACAGLSDRQTERACKDDLQHGVTSPNPSKRGNDSGNTDDQAG